jgi:hypothetical protein
MLAAVGVVSPSNAPLWLRCYHPSEEPRRLHTVLHCALDGVDERLGAPGGTKARRCSWGHTHTRASGALELLSTRLPALHAHTYARRTLAPRTWACSVRVTSTSSTATSPAPASSSCSPSMDRRVYCLPRCGGCFVLLNTRIPCTPVCLLGGSRDGGAGGLQATACGVHGRLMQPLPRPRAAAAQRSIRPDGGQYRAAATGSSAEGSMTR